MAPRTRRACLVEYDSSLRVLNRLVLEAAGFETLTVPPGDDPVAFAARTRPDLIVVHLGEVPPYTTAIVDRLRDDAATQGIPVCAIATSDQVAAEAQAGPNVPVSVIAPFDLDALEGAVLEALDSPPAAAVLPNPPDTPPTCVTVIGDVLNREARGIVLNVVFRRLRHLEPYRTIFMSSHDHLIHVVDHLGTILGAIVTGLQRDLSPSEAFGRPRLQEYVDEHIQLRRKQGLGVLTAVGEYQLLRSECLEVIQGAIGETGVSAAEAVEVVRRILVLFDTLERLVIDKYQLEAPP